MWSGLLSAPRQAPWQAKGRIPLWSPALALCLVGGRSLVTV